MALAENLEKIKLAIGSDKVTLVAVSKTHSADKIKEVYQAGQRHFGENKVQELMDKKDLLPADIQWHLIGHLQTNKVKYIASFIHLIHSVDSEKLLKEIQKEGAKNNRIINVLLQIRIAQEETKFGLPFNEARTLIENFRQNPMPNVRICGFMGMATFTDDETQIRHEFRLLKQFFDEIKSQYFSTETSFEFLCMGMSGDYLLAIEEGSNMVRVGTAIFGSR